MKRPLVCIAIVLSVLAVAAGRSSALADSVSGGWRGGDVNMLCRHGGVVYEATITGGTARLEIDGTRFFPERLTYAPYGFVITAAPKSYVVAFTAHKLLIVDASTLSLRRTVVQCEICPSPLANARIEGEGFSFTLFGDDWCPAPQIAPGTRAFIRPALSRAEREARDNVLSPAESAHIFLVISAAGHANEADVPIANIGDLRTYIVTQLTKGYAAAQSRPGWPDALLGPPTGGIYKVVDWKLEPDTPGSDCLTLTMDVQAQPPAGGSRLKIDNVRRVCLGPGPEHRVSVLVLTNTYVADDTDAEARSAGWEASARQTAESLELRR